MTAKVTVLVPNYKTEQLTKLCLRLLRKYTEFSQAKVIVIDNNSADSSLEYLRTVDWIELIERAPEPDDTPSLSHSRALDLALAKVNTPYVLSIHTDTVVKTKRWLDFLLEKIEHDDKVAGVGSWKLEAKPWYKRWAKLLERVWQSAWYKLRGRDDHHIEGKGDNYYYLRSHCALYRTDLLRELELNFSLEDEVAGKAMHKRLLEAGYDMKFLPSETLGVHVDHLNHATMIFNPELGIADSDRQKGLKRIKQKLKALRCDEILADSSLDQ